MQKFSFSKKHLSKQLLVITGLGLLLITALISSVVLAKRQQDIRQQAYLPATPAQITVMNSSTSLVVGKNSLLTFALNTNQQLVSGVQLNFTIYTGLPTPPTVSVTQNSVLQLITQKVTPVSGGYTYTLILLPPALQSFSSAVPTPFVVLSITPDRQEDIRIIFNPISSMVPKFNTSPVVNLLAPIPDQSYRVTTANQPGKGVQKPRKK